MYRLRAAGIALGAPGALIAAAVMSAAAGAPAAAAAAVATLDRAAPEELTPVHFVAMDARSIGPAGMSGRISDVAYDPASPWTIWLALGTGGVMKSSNNGTTFSAVFEDQPVAAVGAIAVAPSDPKVIWVGTGEANDRNSSSWGDGVYRSTDGGSTWKNVGLKSSRAIARIVVHPEDADTAWIAAIGDLWGPGGDRGLYKTTDAGENWRRVLSGPDKLKDRVGCGDVIADPRAPDVLYAVLYARYRTPWTFVSGPDASGGEDAGGIFKSTDGGETWRQLTNGLPARTARIGLALFPKDPNTLYAIVQSDEGGTQSIRSLESRSGGIFRSDDGGASWNRTSPLNPRPFYFSQIRVDPANADRVYVLGVALHVSEDGGRSFREDRFGKIHPDCHAMAFHPGDPKRLLLGTDGGAYESFDEGKSWRHHNLFAAGEFYRINVDNSEPYRICGGLQDNLNWVGPSRTRSKEGIVSADWINIDGGDGFWCVFDPSDPDIIYAESQRGWLFRFDLGSGQDKHLRAEPAEGRKAFRFHWNAPLIGSRHAKGVMYHAGNHVFRLTDRGEKWAAISPDLSTGDSDKTVSTGSGAETYGVVFALAESPKAAGMLWAGTDDGRLWVTKDDGGKWTDLTDRLPREMRGGWISSIAASAHETGVAYLAVDAHRSQDYAPHLFRTTDGGRRWTRITSNLPEHGPVKVVREDPVNPDLLYAGTEFGLFASLDRGGRWFELGGIPTVAVDDLVVHERDRDLVIATHGRSIYIVDDLTPLQELTPEVRRSAAHLFAPRAAEAFHLLPGFADWNGAAVFRGKNPPEGALISVWVREWTGKKPKIEITDPAGVPVANLTLAGNPGINRVNWNLKPTEDLLTEYGGQGARFVRPGEYKVTLTYGDVKQESTLRVDVVEGVETR